MIDLKLIREQLETVAEKLAKRGYQLDVSTIQSLESERREHLKKSEKLQMARNQIAKEIGLKKRNGDNCDDLLDQASTLSEQTKCAEQACKACESKLYELLSGVPNIPHASVPDGVSEDDNVLVRTIGTPRTFDFEIKDHETLTAASHGIDTALGAQLAGSRFSVLKDEVAQLHRALVNWMLDVQVEQHGYTEHNIPVLAKPETLYGTGQLPKFKEDLFVTNDERELMLIPTAEVQLVNVVANQIIDRQALPIKLCAHSLCFRKEAGSYGKDTKGIFRAHQFEKIELVRLEKPEDAYEALEEITKHAESILQQLNLPYRVMALCAGDMGFAASKTYDIEVWIPSQHQYREISSCSNTEDFQSRRIKARYKNAEKKTVLLHALNGSGVAVGRLLIAVLENYQQADGSVLIPEVLIPYMRGKKHILQAK